MKGLNRAYNDQMDAGTAQFAVYYRDWIKSGGKAPPVPTVSLPPRPSYLEPWGKRSVSLSRSSINRDLYVTMSLLLLDLMLAGYVLLLSYLTINLTKVSSGVRSVIGTGRYRRQRCAD